MIKSNKMKIMLGVVAVFLLIFQALVLGVAAPKGYYLIYDWLFYGINYVIILIFLSMMWRKNRYFKWGQWILGLILLTANTTFFYYLGDVHVVVSKSKDNPHELILKEYKQLNKETVVLKQRGIIFGKKVAVLIGSSQYKTIEKATYKIDWVSGDIAVVTYQASTKDTLQQSIFSFRSSDYVRYQNVAVSLTGKWLEKNNPKNYFLYDKGKIVYANNGGLYYYSAAETEQQGIFSLIIRGDKNKPIFTIILNSDCVFGDDNLIKDGGTITLSPLTLEESAAKVYEREN